MPSMIYLVTGECLVVENDLSLHGDSFTLEKPHNALVEESWSRGVPKGDEEEPVVERAVIGMTPWRACVVTVFLQQVHAIVTPGNVPMDLLEAYEKALRHPSPFQ